MALIELEAAIATLEKHGVASNFGAYLLQNLPTIDAAPVVRGRWVPDGKEHVHCTNCGDGRNIRTQIGWKFCPSCGAQMEGGEGHGTD